MKKDTMLNVEALNDDAQRAMAEDKQNPAVDDIQRAIAEDKKKPAVMSDAQRAMAEDRKKPADDAQRAMAEDRKKPIDDIQRAIAEDKKKPAVMSDAQKAMIRGNKKPDKKPAKNNEIVKYGKVIRYATGKRKRSIAKVWHREQPAGAEGITIIVNSKHYMDYFKRLLYTTKLLLPFKLLDVKSAFFVADVCGGGLTGQVDAILLGISKCFANSSTDYRALLAKAGLLTRDARKVESKKPGYKKARKKEQFSKR